MDTGKSPNLLIATDIGGTNFRIRLSDTSGLELRSRKWQHRMSSPEHFFTLLSSSINALLGPDRSRLIGIGTAIASPVDSALGELVNPPNLNGIDRMPLRDMLSENFDVPVVIENDANAAAVGENRLGAGQGARDMIYVTISTGIGSGIIIDGKLYHGASGGAGEIGHMVIDQYGSMCNCGHPGHWEALSSGYYIARKAVDMLKNGYRSSLPHATSEELLSIDVSLIHQAAKQGDDFSLKLLQEASNYFSIGLANLINIFNPELIVIGGGLSNIADLYINPAIYKATERAMVHTRNTVRFELSELGDDAGLLGAMILIKEKLGIQDIFPT